MKKIVIVLASMIFGLGVASAQNIAQLTELFNNGATALQNGEKSTALDAFRQALTAADALGDEGAEIAGKCKEYIPQICNSIAIDAAKGGNMDAAIASAKEAVSSANLFGFEDAAAEGGKLLGQFLVKKGSDLLTNGDLAGAKSTLEEAVQADTTNASALLKLGQVSMKAGDLAAAEKAFKSAANHGQASVAKKQLANICLKYAASALKNKDYKTALEKALASTEYVETTNAYKVAGNASAQLKDYKGAAKYFGKYLELAPNAPDAAQVKANIEAFKKL